MSSTSDTAAAPVSALASPGTGSADRLAVILIVTIMVLAAFYPETFISGDFSIGVQRVTPLTLLLPLVAIAAVAYYTLRRELLRFQLVDGALLAFMAWLLIRNPSGYNAAVAVKYIVYGLGLFYLTALAMRSPSFGRIFLIALMSIVCLVSLYGFVDFVLQRNVIFGSYILKAVPESFNSLHRAASTFAHPVAYGAFLIQVLPFCILTAFKNAGRKEHLLGIFALAMASVSLFLTFSKGSMLVALIMALGGLLILARKNRKAMLIIALASAVFVGALTFAFRNEMGIELTWRGGFSFMARELSWKAALETSTDQLVTGVGLRNGVDSINQHLDRSHLSRNNALPIDNYYLSLLVEEGAVGLTLWLLFLFMIFFYGIKAANGGGSGDKLLAIAGIFSILGLCLNMVTFDALYMYGNYVFFWVAAGIVRGTVRERRELSISTAPSRSPEISQRLNKRKARTANE